MVIGVEVLVLFIIAGFSTSLVQIHSSQWTAHDSQPSVSTRCSLNLRWGKSSEEMARSREKVLRRTEVEQAFMEGCQKHKRLAERMVRSEIKANRP